MKKRLFLIGLLSMLFLLPVFGANTFSVILNGMAYTPQTQLIIHENTPYVPLSELENLVLATSKSLSTSRHEVKIGNNTLEFTVNGRQVKLGQQKYVLTHPILSFDQKTYVPITELLDLIQYPYTWNKDTNVLTLNAQVPYSTNSNDPTSHRFNDSRDNLKDYPKHLIAFTSPEVITQRVQEAIFQNNYLAFVDSTHINEVLSLSKEKVKTSPYNNISVKIRELGVVQDSLVLKGFKTVPLELVSTNQKLMLKIGDALVDCSNYWSAFYPSQSLTQMDMDMSLDATIMRNLYYYFRDQYDLRDDKFFTPTLTLSDLRTTTLNQEVYHLSLKNRATDYEVSIYRVHPSGSITYIIDLIKK